jgi:predicted metal-dependent hydrolase
VSSHDPHEQHEQCELRWRSETEPLRREAAKALAQWFAACVHARRGNRSGAQSLAAKCLPALEAALAGGLSELYGHDLSAIVNEARSAPWCRIAPRSPECR